MPPEIQRKPIPGYEGMYSITSDGRVFSHLRYDFLDHLLPPKYISVRRRPGRAADIKLYNKGIPKWFTLCSLLYRTFIGSINSNECITRKDKNVSNDALTNLVKIPKGIRWHAEKEIENDRV